MNHEQRSYPSNAAIQNVFIGRVASAPEFSRHGDTQVTSFVLIDNVYAGKDDHDQAKSRPLSIRFTAFGAKAEGIRDHVAQGDQLIVFYNLRNNNFTDKDGVERYGYEFIVDSFRFGAPGATKRAMLEGRETA
jgi:single-strand DNA-binding protein